MTNISKPIGLKTSVLLHGADYNYEQWLDYPEILDTDFKYMKEARCNVMSIGIFSWAEIEPQEGVFNFDWLDELFDRLEANNIYAILGTPSGSKPAWLSKKYPEVCRVDEKGKREPHGQRHNHCRTSPIYREKVAIINRKLAQRYGKRKNLLLWHVSNEYNAGPCYCDYCIDDFRKWLRVRYKTLDNLNKAWWTSFWSHRFTDWNQIFPSDNSISGLMLDWKRFISDQTLDFFKSEISVLREETPNIPITTNFMLPNVDLNYWNFAKYVDVISWDSYPRWHIGDREWMEGVKTAFFHDMHRSYKKAPFMMMESTPSATNWQGISIPKKPNMHLLSSLQAIAHGSNTVQYFQWRQSRGGEEKFHSAVVNHLGDDKTPVFKDVVEVGKKLENLSQIVNCRTNSQVAIIYDLENEWALSLAQLPRSQKKCYQDRCIAHYRALWNLGISCDIIDSLDSPFDNYKLVVAPMLYMLRDGVAEKFIKFVENGGTLILTYLTGLVNDSDLCFLGGFPGKLKELAGIVVEDTDVISNPLKQKIKVKWNADDEREYDVFHYADRLRVKTAEIKGKYTLSNMADTAAITENKFKNGVTWYLATRMEDSFYDDFYKKLIVDLNIKQNIISTLPQGVTCQKRSDEEGEFYFIMNFNKDSVSLNIEDKELIDIDTDSKIINSIHLPSYGIKILKKAM
ncbi:MAG: beta-galactosidase [Sphaerochaeta sp.]